MRPKILAIGFDGLDHELYRGFNRHGFNLLPCFSPVPVTGPAWTSIYTGMSVARHRVRELWGRHGHERFSKNPLVNRLGWGLRDTAVAFGLLQKTGHYDRPLVPYLWDVLGKEGVTVKLFNLPVTWPARKVNGIHVCGIPFNPKGSFCWPRELGSRLPRDYYEIADADQWFMRSWTDRPAVLKGKIQEIGFKESLRRVRSDSERLIDAFISLGDADFEMIQFSFVDRLGHPFGIGEDTVSDLYGLVDDLIGMLMEKSGRDDLMLISDHGFQGTDHTDLGVLGLKGPVFEAGGAFPGRVNVRDFTPTVCAAFGVAYECEGQAINGAVMEAGSEVDELDQQEYLKMRKRLEQIGYF